MIQAIMRSIYLWILKMMRRRRYDEMAANGEIDEVYG